MAENEQKTTFEEIFGFRPGEDRSRKIQSIVVFTVLVDLATPVHEKNEMIAEIQEKFEGKFGIAADLDVVKKDIQEIRTLEHEIKVALAKWQEALDFAKNSGFEPPLKVEEYVSRKSTQDHTQHMTAGE